jgi:hypothetical protein
MRRPSLLYLPNPEPVLAWPMVFLEALRTLDLGRAAAGPVFLQVGTTFVEPTEVGYEPTEGATTDPYPSVPVVCASASVLVRASVLVSVSAVASAIVATFMMVSFALR